VCITEVRPPGTAELSFLFGPITAGPGQRERQEAIFDDRVGNGELEAMPRLGNRRPVDGTLDPTAVSINSCIALRDFQDLIWRSRWRVSDSVA
jgi:hypothetical protein